MERTMKSNTFNSYFLVFLLVLLPCLCISVEPIVERIDLSTTSRLIKSNHHYLDVRTAEEFYEGHIKNSINIPYIIFTKKGKLKNHKFLEQVSGILKKEDLVIVGCLGGVRSLEAAKVLISAGYNNVKEFGGGYEAWVENGYDVVSKPRVGTSHLWRISWEKSADEGGVYTVVYPCITSVPKRRYKMSKNPTLKASVHPKAFIVEMPQQLAKGGIH